MILCFNARNDAIAHLLILNSNFNWKILFEWLPNCIN